MAKHSKRKRKNVSWCDGFAEFDRHPTNKKITTIYIDGITTSLCKMCLDDYNRITKRSDQNDQNNS